MAFLRLTWVKGLATPTTVTDTLGLYGTPIFYQSATKSPHVCGGWMTDLKKTPPLGKNRDTPPPPTRYLRKHVRKAVAQRLVASHYKSTGDNLRGSSVLGCGRWRAHGAGNLNACIEVADGIARYDGHFICGCNWTCEECATATVARNRSWLRGALMPALKDAGLTASLMTLTLAHSYDDDWGQVASSLQEAYGLFDRRVQKHLKRYGCVGKFKALEAPVGANGLHPHYHVLVTHRVGLTADELAELEALLRAAWEKAVAEVGGRCNEHGFDFKPNCINDYVTKMETAHELAAQSTKHGRRKGRTLSQLLDAAGRSDRQAGAEWIRAIKAVGSRNRFHAGGLPKALDIPTPSEWDDDQPLSSDAEDTDKVVVRIEYPQNDHMMATHPALGRPGLAMILRAAARGGKPRVLSMVDALCRDYRNRVMAAPVDVGDQCLMAMFPDVLDAAKQRPLTPDEVKVYLLLKGVNAGLPLSFAPSSAGAEAAAEHSPSAGVSHQGEHRTGEHPAQRTLDGAPVEYALG